MQTTWHPLAPSCEVQAGRNIVAAFAQGIELAVWRSWRGDIQVWESRCPHRSVRLTLGQVLGDRLSCAYHGWQFAAGTAQCVGVPARPASPLPGHVYVRAFPAREASGMVWAASTAVGDDPPSDAVPAGFGFVRSLAVRSAARSVSDSLASVGWTLVDSAWCGTLAGTDARALLLDAQPGLVFLHLWAATVSDGVHAASRDLRAQLQAQAR